MLKEPLLPYVLDSASLIELERSKRLRQLKHPGSRIVIPDRVAREVDRPRTPLERWLRRYPKSITRLIPSGEGSTYLKLLAQTDPRIDDGEAAALAICLHRGGTLVTDDRAAARKAAEHEVRCIDAEQFWSEWEPEQLTLL